MTNNAPTVPSITIEQITRAHTAVSGMLARPAVLLADYTRILNVIKGAYAQNPAAVGVERRGNWVEYYTNLKGTKYVIQLNLG